MITGQINVTKVNKERLFKGEKGTYLNVVLIETPNSKYGDYMICESVSKEEREKGIKGATLGNAKIFKSRKQDSKPATASAPKPANDDDEVPF